MITLISAKIKAECALAPRRFLDVAAGVGIRPDQLDEMVLGVLRGSIFSFDFGNERWLASEHLSFMSSTAENSIYRVTETGSIVNDGKVTRLRVDWFLVDSGELMRKSMTTGLHPALRAGVPRRESFLGRPVVSAYEHRVPRAAYGVDWSPAEMFEYLASSAWDAPGCFILGDVNMGRAQRAISGISRTLVPRESRGMLYHKFASQNSAAGLLRDRFGSNPVWGIEPKFTCTLESTGAVVVKYAPVGSEKAEYLVANHLALRVLKDEDPKLVVDSEILTSEGFVFLQTSRVDRRGNSGRVGVQSGADLDDEVMSGGNWEEFAATACAHGLISMVDRDRLGLLALFAARIGNVERSIDNLLFFLAPNSVARDESALAPLAPAFNLGATWSRERPTGPFPVLAFDPSGVLAARADRLADEFWRRRQ